MGLKEKLKESRNRVGLKQRDVEHETGIKAKTISNWENGVSKPDVDSIILLCKLYKIDPNTLFDWEIYMGYPMNENDYWTIEEASDIENYKNYVRSKRGK